MKTTPIEVTVGDIFAGFKDNQKLALLPMVGN